MTTKPLQTGFVRLWTIEGGAGPANAPIYRGNGRITSVDWPQGTVEPVYQQSPDKYDDFVAVDILKGTKGLPSATLDFQMEQQISSVLRLVRKGCAVDLQAHVGRCKDPSNFDAGWTDGKILILRGAVPTDYSVDGYGAIGSDERAVVMEAVPFTGIDMFELKPLSAGEQAAATISDEIVGIVICDSAVCGECGLPSDGCQVAFALQAESSGSPGIGPAVLWTVDGGTTWTKTIVTSAGVAETAVKLQCVGSYLVVTVTGATGGLHYIPITSLVAGGSDWVKNDSGLTLAAGAPNDIFSAGANLSWVAGDGGYIYDVADITGTAVALQAGDLTSEDLLAIRGTPDGQTLVAVGTTNAVVASINGGVTWSLITGPAVGVDLLCVAVLSERSWWVGTAGGELYYTADGGTTWVLKNFTGSGSGSVTAIDFANESVGYVAHSSAAATPVGSVFRTVNGGYSWVRGPELGSAPTHRSINGLAACPADPNVVFAGGLKDANDGIIIKFA